MNFSIISWYPYEDELNYINIEFTTGSTTKSIVDSRNFKYYYYQNNGNLYYQNQYQIALPNEIKNALIPNSLNEVIIKYIITDTCENTESKTFRVYVDTRNPEFQMEIQNPEVGPAGYYLFDSQSASVKITNVAPYRPLANFTAINFSVAQFNYQQSLQLHQNAQSIQLKKSPIEFLPDDFYTLQFVGYDLFGNAYNNPSQNSFAIAIDSTAPVVNDALVPQLVGAQSPLISFKLSDLLVKDLTLKTRGVRSGIPIENTESIQFQYRKYSSEQLNFRGDQSFWDLIDDGPVQFTITVRDWFDRTAIAELNSVKDSTAPTVVEMRINGTQGEQYSTISDLPHISNSMNFTIELSRALDQSFIHSVKYQSGQNWVSLAISSYRYLAPNRLEYIINSASIPEGIQSLEFRYKDNIGGFYSVYFYAYCDRIAPTISIESPYISNAGLIEIKFEDAGIVNQTFEIEIDSAIQQYMISQTNIYDISNQIQHLIGQFYFEIIIRARDWAENTRVVTRQIYFDNTPPLALAWRSYPSELFQNGTYQPSINMLLQSDSSAKCANFTLVELQFTTTIQFSGNHFIPIQFSGIADGSYTIRIRVFDFAFNFADLELVIVVDSAAPIILQFEGPQLAGLNIPTLKYTISEPNLASVSLFNFPVNLNSTLPLNNTSTNATIDFWNQLPSGIYNITLRATDRAGNIALKNFTISKDIDGPRIMISAPKQYGAYSEAPIYQFSVSDPNIRAINIKISNQSFPIELNERGEYSGQMPYFPYIYTIYFTVEAWDTLDNYSNETVTIYQPDAPERIRENTLDLKNLFTDMPIEVKIGLGAIGALAFIITIKKKPEEEAKAYSIEEEFE